MSNIFLLIDGHAVIYRAYHAFVELTTHEGMLVNAVYGFSRILLTVLREEKPLHAAVAFDHPKATFRHTDFAGYKEHRPEMPDDLKPQIALIKNVVIALNIPQFEVEGYEADDVIGTLARQITEQTDDRVLIVTGDRDTFQLVNDRVHVWMPGRGKGQADTEYDSDGVHRKMDVRPDQIIDLKALMGDASDNIPGVSGVGAKTAAKLLHAFDTLEGVYQGLVAPEKLSQEQKALFTKGLVQKLANGHELAVLSKKLATIDCQVPISLDVPACEVTAYDKDVVRTLFEELQFKSLLSLLPPDAFEMSVQQALF
jgi:DNA polymerase-1